MRRTMKKKTNTDEGRAGRTARLDESVTTLILAGAIAASRATPNVGINDFVRVHAHRDKTHRQSKTMKGRTMRDVNKMFDDNIKSCLMNNGSLYSSARARDSWIEFEALKTGLWDNIQHGLMKAILLAKDDNDA